MPTRIFVTDRPGPSPLPSTLPPRFPRDSNTGVAFPTRPWLPTAACAFIAYSARADSAAMSMFDAGVSLRSFPLISPSQPRRPASRQDQGYSGLAFIRKRRVLGVCLLRRCAKAKSIHSSFFPTTLKHDPEPPNTPVFPTSNPQNFFTAAPAPRGDPVLERVELQRCLQCPVV